MSSMSTSSVVCVSAQVACEVELKLMAWGSEFMNVPPPEEARAHRDAFFADGRAADGSMEWPRLRRQLDAEGSTYER